MTQSTMPSARSHIATSYCRSSRSVHGPTKNAQAIAPMTGITVGATKCGPSTRSLRKTRTAMFTIVKTPRSNSAVVPPSTLTTSSASPVWVT